MRSLALVALAALSGCAPRVTEVLLTVSNDDLTLGVDANQLHLVAVDPAANFNGLDRRISLCGSGTAPPCYALPLSVVLYPGARVGDAVRVQVDAELDGAVVLANAAIITFAAGARERLEIQLHKACVHRAPACADSDQICDADGNCTAVTTAPPDMGPPSDLAAVGADLPDTICGSHGMPCCGGTMCNTADLACFSGTCQSCGGMSQSCCPTANPCNDGLGCNDLFQCTSDCGVGGGPCCAHGVCNAGVCNSGICLTPGCGANTQGCCSGMLCGDGLSCVNNVCKADNCTTTCCNTTAPSHCVAGLYCETNGNACLPCGHFGEVACGAGTGCGPGVTPYSATGLCGCDVPGDTCCGGTNGVCVGTLSCVSGYCQ